MARTRKSRRLRLPISIGWGADRSFAPTVDDWVRIESAYGVKLNADTRDKVVEIVENYMRFQPGEGRAPFADDALRYLDDLEKAGSRFWHLLLAQSYIPMTGEGERAHIDQAASQRGVAIGFVQSHFGRNLKKFEFRHGTDWGTLLDIMGGCMASFTETRTYLREQAARVGFVEGTAWSAMIWLLSEHARLSSLPAGVSKHDDPSAASPFVRFIWELQRSLPEAFRRHDASYAALTEAISSSNRKINRAIRGRLTDTSPPHQPS